LADIGILYFGKKLLERLNLPIKNIFWYALNPFIIIEMTGNLHFEPVMLFFLICCLYKLQQQKWTFAAILLACSISVKLIPLLFLPLFYQWFVKKEQKWYERNIKFSKINKPEFLNILTNIKKFEKKIGFNISYKQKFIEYSPLTMEYLKIISKKIRISGGGILIIDYGNFDKTMKNTLQSISNHKYNNVLNNFGQSDITYSINFRLIEKIVKKLSLKVSGVTNQKNFLTNLGILKRAEIISKNLSFSKKTDIYFRVKRLIDKNLMGELFKVMLITKQNTNFQTGFKN
jgi:SAM-dependent MidA family methyltransferase